LLESIVALRKSLENVTAIVASELPGPSAALAAPGATKAPIAIAAITVISR
jgi:hypothetical protein